MNNYAKWHGSIKYPSLASEFEIQAYLYNQLLLLGLDVRGEVTPKQGNSRLDLVIFDENKKPIKVIEIKKTWKKTKTIDAKQQIERYSNYGVEVDILGSLEQAKKYIAESSWKIIALDARICCSITRQGRRCPITANRKRKRRWYCHVHDPMGKFRRKHIGIAHQA